MTAITSYTRAASLSFDAGNRAASPGPERFSLHGGARSGVVEQTRLEGAQAKSTSTKKTVADFTLIGATAKDKADLKQALDYLQKTGADGKPVSPTAVKLLNQLPKGMKLAIVHDGNDSYNPNTKTISWDPRSGLQVSSGAGTQSAALGFIHEVDHAANGLLRPKATGDAYDNTEEKRVITGSETQIAHDLGEPTRTDHRGTATANEPSSIAHTAVTYPKPGAPVPKPTVTPEQAAHVMDKVVRLLSHIF